MATVYGQIDSLKRLRAVLDDKGISRFNSTGDINKFIKYFDRHKDELLFKVEREYEQELENLVAERMALQEKLNSSIASVELEVGQRIDKFKSQSEKANTIETKNPLVEVLYWYKHLAIELVLFFYRKKAKKMVRERTLESKNDLRLLDRSIRSLRMKRPENISRRFDRQLYQLEYTRKVAEDLNPLIAGAIGENLVANELKKLSQDCVVFNDFKLKFKRPIYNKKGNDYIYSIQIDHLVITTAGIFLIESKNWSKKSIANLDLRSPVSQMQRTSYALFVLLNGKDSELNGLLKQHHWGERLVPIKNVVAMINNKPYAKFKHVAIKKLDELNSYLEYFDPVYHKTDVKKIEVYLKNLQLIYS
jgi:hypothetical protein